MSKAGRAELAVSDVCPATSVRAVRKSAAVRMAPHVTMCWESANASQAGEARDVTNVSITEVQVTDRILRSGAKPEFCC